ncbi:MAG: hypothetical protein AAGF11_12620 [Myxococcota bacterium]
MRSPYVPRDRADCVLNHSLESLLVSGGDGRIWVHPQSGLNKYGCAPRLRDAIAFGSCTASSPTELGLRGARRYLERLRIAARAGGQEAVDAEAEALLEESRAWLLHELRLEPSRVRVAFCPSGTDAEFLALALARASSSAPIVNIIAGPSEVGGGTIDAAAGRYFDPSVPAGGERVVGEPIDAELSASVRIRTIALRTAEGVMREPEVMDAVAVRQVEEALADDARVMLHVVAHSKTGAHAPSLECVATLRERFGERITVMIDAAQGRLSRRGLNEAIAEGYLVEFTGSKFYGGLPFSGALFVPPELWPERTGITALSPGLSDFSCAPELPRDWIELRASLPAAPNLGLVLRWGAALAQIEAYYKTEADSRLAILRTWEAEVPKLLGASPHVSLFPVEPVLDPDIHRLLESKTTVFPFFVRRDPQGPPLAKAQLVRIFHWLNRDLTGLLPELDEPQKAVLARELHIGQPVLLTDNTDRERCVLRLALGGSLITRVASELRLGPTLAAREDWLRAQIQITRKKLELIVEHLDTLLDRDRQ